MILVEKALGKIITLLHCGLNKRTVKKEVSFKTFHQTHLFTMFVPDVNIVQLIDQFKERVKSSSSLTANEQDWMWGLNLTRGGRVLIFV